MKKIGEAKQILKALGLDSPRQNEMSALTLLALCRLSPRSPWSSASNPSLKVTKGVMAFVAETYLKVYAPNTRETFRRQVLHQFTQAGVTAYNPDIPDLPVNSPRAHYALTPECLAVVRAFATPKFEALASEFVKNSNALRGQYETKREFSRIPLILADGQKLYLSPGQHNEIGVAVLKEFGPRFAPGAELLYIGDTENKETVFEKEKLQKLGCKILDNGKLPDIILYDPKKNWLFLIEAVASHGPISQKRVQELKTIFAATNCGLIFVTAFADANEFKKHAKEIAWDSEVWLSDSPEHLIHYNGDRFFGPR